MASPLSTVRNNDQLDAERATQMLVIRARSHSAVREGKREMLEAEPLMACAAAAHAI